MEEFKEYKRIENAEIRQVTDRENMDGLDALIAKNISVSPADVNKGSPTKGDMIARNPKNHKDQWLIAAQYFKDNFEEI